MKKVLLLSVFTLGAFVSNAQVNETQGFEGTTSYNDAPSGWTYGGFSNTSESARVYEGSRAVYKNIYGTSSSATGNIVYTSPVASNGNDMSISFAYKVYPYSISNPAVNGNMNVSYSVDGGTTYTQLDQINFTAATGGFVSYSKVIAASNLPVGSNFKLKVDAANGTNGDWYLCLDSFLIVQNNGVVPSCASNFSYTANDDSCANFGGVINWDDVADATSYEVKIGTTSGGNEVSQGTVSSSHYDLDIANVSTTYYVNVTPKNGTLAASGCTEYTFTTNSERCYCSSVPTSNDGNGVSQIEFATVTQTFTQGDVTYGDHTATPVNVYKGVDNEIKFTFQTGYTYNVNIWVDVNNDYTFSEDELFYQGESTAADPTVLSTMINIPTSVADGTYRMRVGTADLGQATPTPCYSGSYGVTMDFTVNVMEDPNAGTINNELSGLNVYPNPVSDVLTITNDTAISTVEVFDVNGRRLVNEVANATSTTINVSSFATGTYFVKVTANGKTTTKQIVVK